MTTNETTKILTLGVLAGAYKGGRLPLKALLTHSSTNGRNALCGGVKEDNLVDEYSDVPGNDKAPTCKRCLKLDSRFQVAK